MTIKVKIRKDGYIPSRPWCADLETKEGFQIKNWMFLFKTKRDIVREILSVKPDAIIIR